MKKQILNSILLVCFSLLTCQEKASAQCGALRFDNSIDYVNVPDNNSIDLNTTYTIEAWVKVSDNANNTIVDKGDYRFLFQTHPNGNSGLGLYNPAMGWRYSAGVVPVNVWCHVAVTFNQPAGEVRFYLNGSLMSVHTGISTPGPDNGPMWIGRQSPLSCNCNTMGGEIDELRIWNIVRSQSDIQNNMTACLTGTEPGLCAYYKFSDGTGSSIVDDLTPNNNNGTLANMNPATDWTTSTSGACCTGSCTIINQTVTAAQSSFICSGSTTINLGSSETTTNYTLRNNANNAVIAGPTAGTGGPISFPTGTITSTMTYNVFVQKSPTCTLQLSQTPTVTINPIPNVTLSAGATAFCGSGSTTVTTSASTTGYDYYLRNNATNAVVDGPVAGTGSGLTFNTGTISSTTTYEVYAETSGGGGCNRLMTQTITVTINSFPTVTASATASAVCNGSNVTLTGGGASSYVWSGGVSNGVAFAPTSTQNYTVTGTDGNSCSNTATVAVTVNALPAVTANTSATAVCNGSQLILSGSGASSYTWSGGVTNNVAFTPLATDTYTVTGTDGNGCTDTDAITVTVNSLPTVTANTTATVVCAGTQVTLSGSGASSFTWTGGVMNNVAFTPATTDTYTVTGTDGNGCTDTDAITVTVNSLPTVTANTTATAVCAGTQVTLSGSGASSYTWTASVTDNVAFSPIATDTYTVTGTDGNGCTDTDAITVTVNSLPTVTVNTTATAVCAGTQVTLSASGATSYVWTGGVTDNVAFIPTVTDTYTVSGTDANGCTETDIITVTVNALPAVTASTSAGVVCAGAPVTLSGSGANSYAWTGGVMDNVAFTPVVTDTYTVTGTDGNNCTNSATVTVTVNALPVVTANTTAAAVCTGSQVTLSGSGAASYTWTGGVTDNVAFTPVSTDTYTVTGTDGNNCMNTATVTVAVNALPVITASATDSAVCEGSTVTLFGTGALSYVWTGGVTDNVAFTPIATDTYTVTGTDGNNCSNTATVTVIVNPAPVVTMDLSSVDTLCVTTSGTALPAGSPAGGFYNGFGVFGNSFFADSAGLGTHALTYTYTDSLGCTANAQDSIYVDVCNGENINEIAEWSVYPNPSNGILFLNAPAEGCKVVMYNSVGEQVLVQQLVSGENAINMMHLGDGIYLVKMDGKSEQRYCRVVLNK